MDKCGPSSLTLDSSRSALSNSSLPIYCNALNDLIDKNELEIIIALTRGGSACSKEKVSAVRIEKYKQGNYLNHSFLRGFAQGVGIHDKVFD